MSLGVSIFGVSTARLQHRPRPFHAKAGVTGVGNSFFRARDICKRYPVVNFSILELHQIIAGYQSMHRYLARHLHSECFMFS